MNLHFYRRVAFNDKICRHFPKRKKKGGKFWQESIHYFFKVYPVSSTKNWVDFKFSIIFVVSKNIPKEKKRKREDEDVTNT